MTTATVAAPSNQVTPSENTIGNDFSGALLTMRIHVIVQTKQQNQMLTADKNKKGVNMHTRCADMMMRPRKDRTKDTKRKRQTRQNK